MPYEDCDRWRAAVLKEIAAIKPAIVFVSGASWVRPIMRDGAVLPEAQQMGARQESFLDLLKALLASGAEVRVIAGTPLFTEDPVRCLVNHPGHEETCVWPLSSSLPKARFPFISQQEMPSGSVLLDIAPSLCPNGLCRGITAGWPIMYDNGHLSPIVTESLSGFFDPSKSGHRSHQ
jgi:hypothetical protein